jgi:uncharacterized protein YbjT (DUF2867 family)
MDADRRILLTGASGYVGGRLLDTLCDRGATVRAMLRDPARGRLPGGVEVARGDAVSGEGLAAALDETDVAYYLIHSMGRGNGKDFAALDRRAARNFGDAAREAGVRRIVYLGGLEPTADTTSEHLQSREEVAELLSERVESFVHARAAMVIGAQSASFEMLRALVHRLPAMICPRWIDTRTQPIAIADVVASLADAGERDEVPAELQLGGADVLSYRDMMGRFARVEGRRPPAIIRVPVLSPRLSSYWVTLVTPVESGLVRPLVDGLRSEMVVRTAPPPGINDAPKGFDEAVRAALDGE